MKKPSKEEALLAVETMLRYIGEDPWREGLKDTPKRIVRSWEKLYGGYNKSSKELLSTAFKGEGYDQMVFLGPVEFYSTCEHHLLPFSGVAYIGYIPGDIGRVVGVSKLARLVEIYARRLQIQERMTKQIADALEDCIQPAGVGVVVKAQHLCMTARGVEKKQALMITSAMRGALLEKDSARMEFLEFVK